ncbi:hypothetical protein J19TS2_43800 [Cohnella xylanilytica]|nr:hypothetical protein J19TS2_43800 [Cohnella xylanilytica]
MVLSWVGSPPFNFWICGLNVKSRGIAKIGEARGCRATVRRAQETHSPLREEMDAKKPRLNSAASSPERMPLGMGELDRFFTGN